MKTYLFYDLETTGLSQAFDQILQFAAIRTDLSLREIERHTVDVKLRPDVIPVPGALVTNRFTVAEALSGVCEYEAMGRIHGLVNEPGTVSIGFNSLGFDDLFLRFSFHRNLLAPYTHQHANGCGRADLLPVAVFYWLWQSDVLHWPEVEGRTSLRLEHLNECNRLATGRAHTALADVEAALELARRFHARRELWHHCLGFFDTATDQRRIGRLPSFQESGPPYRWGHLVHTRYGSQRAYQVPVLLLGDADHYTKRTAWLRLDDGDLSATTPETIADAPVLTKKLGEPGFLIPPPREPEAQLDGARRRLVDENLRWLARNPDLLQGMADHHCAFTYPEDPPLDLDAALYQIGFLSRAEQAACRGFHAATPAGKAALLPSLPTRRTRELATRLLGRNYPDYLAGPYAADYAAYLQSVYPGPEGEPAVDHQGRKRTTPEAALAAMDALQAKGRLEAEQLALLTAWKGYISEMA